MRWLLVGGGGLVAIVVVVAGVVTAVGAALPRAHVATRAARFPVGPDALWATLIDVAGYPRWRTDIRAVEMLPAEPGQLAWRERARHGSVSYAMTNATAPVRLTTTITDPSLPYGGSWELAITPDGDGARLVVTEYGVVRNPLFRFVSRFVLGHTATLDAYLSALGRHHGVAIVPEHAPPVPRAASTPADVAELEVPHGT
jgi:hypothetical protein